MPPRWKPAVPSEDSKPAKTQKFKAGWRQVGTQRIYARSRWEANWAFYLEWLKSLGEIQSWEHEPETFWFEAIRRGVRSYLPDFKVKNKDGSICYYEVKGYMDPKSKTKIKRMAKYHPLVKLVVIDEKSYRDIAKKVSSIVPGWEFGG